MSSAADACFAPPARGPRSCETWSPSATTWTSTTLLTEVPPPDDAREREVQAAARQFKAWLDNWRATAAATITRRDHLIRLGLASRRASSTEADPVEDATPAPAPVAPAPVAPAPLAPACPAPA